MRQQRCAEAGVIFEAVPEVLDLKRQVLAHACALAPQPIIASTTSTILVDELASAVERPERFLNAHWLNPAFLVPLVEISPSARTDPSVTQRLRALLESIGKVPVVCAARPGYIVPRIQALAMNEAARLVEEGVASAEDIDKAIKYGFGVRFATLGMLEFIDWGGGDILYYASRYLTDALGSERYAAPQIIERNMAEEPHRAQDAQGLHELRGARYRGLPPATAAGVRQAARPSRPDTPASFTGLGASAEHILQHASADDLGTIHRDGRAHHRNVEMAGGVAAGKLVGARREQEIAGNRAQLGAVAVLPVVHGSAS